MLYMIFPYDWEPVLIQRILIGFEKTGNNNPYYFIIQGFEIFSCNGGWRNWNESNGWRIRGKLEFAPNIWLNCNWGKLEFPFIIYLNYNWEK